MFDPKTVLIQGDLSRADTLELVKLCQGRSVVEFGMGASTLLLARCAKKLVSYDTDQKWCDVTQRRTAQIPDKTCEPQLVFSPRVPRSIPPCDVLFVDGLSSQRIEWGRKFFQRRVGHAVLIHDSRRRECWRIIGKLVMYKETSRWIDNIQFHVGDSNMIIVWKRSKSANYFNWNRTERDDNRVGGGHQDYLSKMPSG